jgi:hypothetical protein
MACSVSDREARGGCGSITILRTTLTSFAPVSLRRLGSSHNDTLGRSTGTEKYETRQYFMITESRERRDRLCLGVETGRIAHMFRGSCRVASSALCHG